VTVLSEWLQLMLAEIARKREEAERARAEEARRVREHRTTRQRSEHEDA
jgi:septal ring factor EnvC (AmiA/AmiB activator)